MTSSTRTRPIRTGSRPTRRPRGLLADRRVALLGGLLSSLLSSLLGGVLGALPGAGPAQAAETPQAARPGSSASAPAQPACGAPGGTRPRVGLVLSGGGARGLAHIGVLKILERERIAVDCIAGTSMGAIIGGLYASGMTAAEIEAELLKIDWDSLFASRVERAELSLRRKELDFEVSPLIELGWRDGELRVPVASVSTRGLETLLRRLTLPVRRERDFDRLPIPYRAVATNMETGQALVLRQGDLALAMRSSMSVPGLFAPVEVDGQVLGDGGLVDNTPVDVAQDMGADVLIVSNIGTPLATRAELNSLAGITAQTINILTEQNVQRSLARLKPQDVLIAPRLEGLTAADFDRARDFIAQGEIQADAAALRLTRLQLAPADYLAWRQAHRVLDGPVPVLAFVGFEGSQLTRPQRLAPDLESQPGQAFDEQRAERDARRLAATGDYLRADYRLVDTAVGEGLLFELEDKPWGPNYLRIGLDLSTEQGGASHFNIKLSHVRQWLDDRGSEWRNFLRIGTEPAYSTEWFRLVDTRLIDGLRPFIAPYAGIDSRHVDVYDAPDANGRVEQTGRIARATVRTGVDLGLTWRELGELRLGPWYEGWRDRLDFVTAAYDGPGGTAERSESGLRLRLVLDQLDFAYFPRRGWRLEAEAAHIVHSSGFRRTDDDGRAVPARNFDRYTLQGQGVVSLGPHTFQLYGRALLSGRNVSDADGRFGLGGFQQLSGYVRDQLRGDNLVFGRLGYYVRLGTAPLTRGLWAGSTLETGNVWNRREDVRLQNLRTGMSLYLGADTAFGPLYLAGVYSPQTRGGIVLFLGRP